MPKRLFVLLPLNLLLLTPTYAFSEPGHAKAALQACYAEAQSPVVTSSAYVYGNARQREQLLNGANGQVYAVRRLCYRLATSGSADSCADLITHAVDVYDDKSAASAKRLTGLCEVLSGHGTTVDGL